MDKRRKEIESKKDERGEDDRKKKRRKMSGEKETQVSEYRPLDQIDKWSKFAIHALSFPANRKSEEFIIMFIVIFILILMYLQTIRQIQFRINFS